MNIKEAIELLVNNKNISKTDTSKIMYQIMNDEITPAQFGAFVTALRMKGDIEYSLSIRDIHQFFNQLFKNTLKNPNSKDVLEQTFNQVILFKFEDPSEREIIKVRIHDSFGIQL